MKVDDRFEHYINEARQAFSGWDFSYITGSGRMQLQLLPWSLGSILIPYIRCAQSLLDMGTGGGEFLSALQPFPVITYATEGYPPNVPVARRKLEPLGVQVVYVEDDEKLPLPDRLFDVVMNQHESYAPSEIRRILSEQGVFITQQVGGTDCYQINDLFGVPLNAEFAHWNLDYAASELRNHGFNVTFTREDYPVQRFYDVGAIIYYLTAIPWQVPDFTVDRYRDELHHIHELIRSQGYFEVRQHRFIMIASL